MAMFAAFPSTTMDSTTVGGRRRLPPTVVEAAEGRLHNLAQGLGSRRLMCYLASLHHGCLACGPDLTPVAIKTEHQDTLVVDVLPTLSAPCAPSGLPLPALCQRRAGADAGASDAARSQPCRSMPLA